MTSHTCRESLALIVYMGETIETVKYADEGSEDSEKRMYFFNSNVGKRRFNYLLVGDYC